MSDIRLRLSQACCTTAVLLVASWGATQWVAFRLHQQMALGQAWFSHAGLKLYAPWSVWRWCYHFGFYAPDLFERATLAAVAAGPVALALNAWIQHVSGRGRQQPRTYGTARWATLREIRRAGLRRSAGVVLGELDGAYLRHEGPEHVIAVAPTRSGKGVGLVIPTLLSWTGSVIVHDIKGENWRCSAGWRARFSRCVLFDPTDIRSACFNPLAEVRLGDGEVRDVQNIADMLVDPEGAVERRNHWNRTSHSLLVGAILHVLYAYDDKSLSSVAELLSDPERSFQQTLEHMLNTNHLGTVERPSVHPVVAAAARDLLNKADNERSGVLSTATSFLSLYRDPIIAALTSRCDWRISDFLEERRRTSLYLVVPPSDITRTRPLIRLILNQIVRRLTEQMPPAQDQRSIDLLLLLDEFPALGRLDFFETSLAFLAGYGVRAFLIAQSLNQLARTYGDNNSVLDNCHVRIIFSPNDDRSAERISTALGTSTEQRAMRNYAGPRSALWLPNISVSQQETARQLLTPGEIMQLPTSDEIILMSGMAPIRARKLRYYKHHAFRRRVLPTPYLEPRTLKAVPPVATARSADPSSTPLRTAADASVPSEISMVPVEYSATTFGFRDQDDTRQLSC